MKKIIVPVSRHYRCSEKENIQEYVQSVFKMPIPSHVHVFLTDKMIDKMKNVQRLMVEHHLTTIEFLTSYCTEEDPSYVELYKNDEKLAISQYEDFDRMWDTIKTTSLHMTCESFQSNKFSIQLIYAAGYTEFVFSTNFFDIN